MEPIATPNVVRAADAFASSTIVLPYADIVVLAGSDNVLMSTSTSLSINAPAAVTFAVSVTSAEASMLSSLVPSVATSRPSKVELVVIAPVIAPPAFGSAAFAVVVVEVNTAFRDAISTPSTVPPTTKLLPMVTLLLASSITALDAGYVRNIFFVPTFQLTALLELEDVNTVVRAIVPPLAL